MGVRPTSSRVREALFSIVGQTLSGLRVLDACGGSGLIGFEAASRGAVVVIAEQVAARAAAIAFAADALGLPVQVVSADAANLPAHLAGFDGVYLDPPYDLDPSVLLAALARRANGWLVLEQRFGAPPAATPPGFEPDPPRRYGDTELRVFRRAQPSAEG